MTNQPTTTWYELSSYDYRIRPIEVVKETEHTVSIRTNRNRIRRCNKHQQFADLYPTREQAIAAAIERVKRRIKHDEQSLNENRERLIKLKAEYPG